MWVQDGYVKNVYASKRRIDKHNNNYKGPDDKVYLLIMLSVILFVFMLLV